MNRSRIAKVELMRATQLILSIAQGEFSYTGKVVFLAIATGWAATVNGQVEKTPASFAVQAPQRVGRLSSDLIHESSGLAASMRHPDCFWTHNDSGDAPRLFLIDKTGKHLATVNVGGITAVDWEDMSSCEIDGKPVLCVGDIGDNGQVREQCQIHFIVEPKVDIDHHEIVKLEVQPERSIHYRYQDGPVNCECLAIDPDRSELWLVTRPGTNPSARRAAGVYRLNWEDSPESGQMARRVADFPAPMTSGMDFSPDGRLAAIRSYTHGRLFVRPDGRTWEDVFRHATGQIFATPVQRQGEAICFDAGGEALFVTSELVAQPIWRLGIQQKDKE